MPTIIVRVSEGMKAEIEALGDPKYIGIWPDQSHFVREALDEHIKRYWQGERFCQTLHPDRNRKEDRMSETAVKTDKGGE